MRSQRQSLLVAGILAVSGTLGAAQGRPDPPVITPVVESDGVRPGTTVRAAIIVVLPDGYHVQSNAPRDPSLIPTQLAVEAPAGVRVEEVVFPASTEFVQEGATEPLDVFEHEFIIGVRLTIASDVASGDLVVPARFRYQTCDDKLCYAPATADTAWTLRVVPADTPVSAQHADILNSIAFGTGAMPAALPAATRAPASVAGPDAGVTRLDDFTVLGTAGGYLGTQDFLTFIRNAETGVTERGLFEGRGPIAIVLIVLLGGLALNLTPCVLPMVPINLAVIGAGAQASSRRRGLLLGATYGAAMAFVYGTLGLIVILTAGTFGTINASPWFNLSIAVLFLALALAMFDVITIDFSSLSSRFTPGAGRGTFMLAFTMGVVAALLAGACVAPVVIQVVLFSSNLYATGTTIALALPFFLGLGMAIPWPIAGAGLASLPKPGPWMIRVKQVFGVLILGTAVYYGHMSYTLFADRWVDAAEVASSVHEKLEAGWHASLADGLAAAEREQKPVLIDMWATWCKNCLTMDRTTLQDSAVIAALDGYVKIKFQAEQPDEEPARTMMKRFQAVGLPTYVILRPNSLPLEQLVGH